MTKQDEARSERRATIFNPGNGDHGFVDLDTGSIGFDVGGTVITKPLRDWHALALREFAAQPARTRGHLGSTVDGGIDDHDEAQPAAAASDSEVQRVPREWRSAMRKLVFMARTSGGIAGADAGLMKACEEAEALLALPYLPAEAAQPEARQLVPSVLGGIASPAQPEVPTGNDDCDDCEATRERMADILTRSVNALRGDPPALTMWSWHDLPERITAAMNELRGAMELAAQPAETTRSEKMREAGYTRRPSLREYQKDGDDTEATQPAVATITDAMVVAYLRANDEYWKGTDELPKPPAKWRAGTVKEATRESLKAALNVAEAAQPWQEPPRLTKSQIDFILGDSFLAANGSIYSTRVYDFVRAVEDALAAPVPAQERGELTDSEINTLINDYFLSSGKATSGDMVLRFARAVLAADRPAPLSKALCDEIEATLPKADERETVICCVTGSTLRALYDAARGIGADRSAKP